MIKKFPQKECPFFYVFLNFKILYQDIEVSQYKASIKKRKILQSIFIFILFFHQICFNLTQIASSQQIYSFFNKKYKKFQKRKQIVKKIFHEKYWQLQLNFNFEFFIITLIQYFQFIQCKHPKIENYKSLKGNQQQRFSNYKIPMHSSNKNKYDQLQTVRQVACFKAIGKVFCNGISNRYDDNIPQTLKEVLSTIQLNKFMKYYQHLNYKVSQYWPCSFAYYCGHIWCICTLGLSLCLPLVCIKQVESVLTKQIKRINQDILRDNKLQMRLVKNCCQSKLIIEQIDFNQFQI